MTKSAYKFYKDPSLLFLIIANLLVSYQAISEKWQLVNLLAVYLGQSVIIGIFNYFNLRSLEAPSKRDSFLDVDSTFFAIHFGIFHFVYFIFVIVYSVMWGKVDFFQVLMGVSVFALNHTYSYFFNQKNLRMEDKSILMFLPYTRVLPMHVVIILAMLLGKSYSLWIFICLKVLADVISHVVLHTVTSKDRSQAPFSQPS